MSDADNYVTTETSPPLGRAETKKLPSHTTNDDDWVMPDLVGTVDEQVKLVEDTKVNKHENRTVDCEVESEDEYHYDYSDEEYQQEEEVDDQEKNRTVWMSMNIQSDKAVSDTMERNVPDDASSLSSSWSLAPSAGIVSNDHTSALSGSEATSMIQEMDQLALANNFVSCPHCTYRNPVHARICGDGNDAFGCGLALVANPSTNLDEELALTLLREEESKLDSLPIVEAKKRNLLGQQPLLSRSQLLSSEICHYVNNLNRHEQMVGVFSALPEASLTVLASRFLNVVDQMRTERDPSMAMCLHFSNKQSWRLTQIRQDGFGASSFLSNNMSSALVAPSGGMKSISETKESGSKDSNLDSGLMGWIALVVSHPPKRTRSTSAISDHVVLKDSSQALPLIYCDASVMRNPDNDANIRNIVQGLKTIVYDFFESSGLLLQSQKSIQHSETEKVELLTEGGEWPGGPCSRVNEKKMSAEEFFTSLHETLSDQSGRKNDTSGDQDEVTKKTNDAQSSEIIERSPKTECLHDSSDSPPFTRDR